MRKPLQSAQTETTTFLEISFGGTNDIALSTLTETLNNTLNCLTKIADITDTSDKYIKFVVDSVKPGSFVLTIKEIITQSETLIAFASGIVGIFVGILDIRKHLQGKNPLELFFDDKKNICTITNQKREKRVYKKNTVNIYINNNELEKYYSVINNCLDQDGNRTGLKVRTYGSNQKENIVEYTPEDIANTKEALDIEQNSSELKEEITEQWVKVKRPCFYGDMQWDFILSINGNPITASIEDKEWLKKVQSDQKITFNSWTKMLVKLRSRYKVDTDGKSIGKVKYSVLEVLRIENPTDEQMTFDDLK